MQLELQAKQNIAQGKICIHCEYYRGVFIMAGRPFNLCKQGTVIVNPANYSCYQWKEKSLQN